MIAISRREVRLEDGLTVTVGPITIEEIRAFQREHENPDDWVEVFAAHIEAHPFDVADVRELDAATLAPIADALVRSIKAGPPIRGRRLSCSPTAPLTEAET